MRTPTLAASALALLTQVSSCLAPGPFRCASDGDCDLGPGGECAPTSFCSYRDDDCVGGQRYEPGAGGGLGGQYVGDEPDGPDETGSSSGGVVDDATAAVDSDGNSTDGSTGGPPTCGAHGERCCGEAPQCDAGLSCIAEACTCVVAVAAGTRHTCALTQRPDEVPSHLWCWGDGTGGADCEPPASPAPIGPGDEDREARGHLLIDLFVEAMRCDLTRIVSFSLGSMATGRHVVVPCDAGFPLYQGPQETASWCLGSSHDTPLSNLWLTVLETLGVKDETFGDATETLEGLWA